MPDHGELLRAIPAPEAPDERKPEPVHVLAAGVGPAIARLTAELVEAQKTARKSTTLRDAAEALLKVATGCWLEEPDDTGAMRDALTALRAALAAEDAWRARAEAAIARMPATSPRRCTTCCRGSAR